MSATEAPTVEAVTAALSSALDAEAQAATHYAATRVRYERAIKREASARKSDDARVRAEALEALCAATREYDSAWSMVLGCRRMIDDLRTRLHTARAHARMAGDL